LGSQRRKISEEKEVKKFEGRPPVGKCSKLIIRRRIRGYSQKRRTRKAQRADDPERRREGETPGVKGTWYVSERPPTWKTF